MTRWWFQNGFKSKNIFTLNIESMEFPGSLNRWYVAYNHYFRFPGIISPSGRLKLNLRRIMGGMSWSPLKGILPGKLTCPLKINQWLEDVFTIEIVPFQGKC